MHTFFRILYFCVKPIAVFLIKTCTTVNPQKILFCSQPSFSDNSKAMYDYLINNRNLVFSWLVFPNEKIKKEEYPRTNWIKATWKHYNHYSFRAIKECYTSGIVFYTHGSPAKEIGKRNNQLIVNLWHGCGYKKNTNIGKKWIETNPFDYALVPGSLFIKPKMDFWGCNSEAIIPIGYPRYDEMLADNKHAEKFVKEIIGDNQFLIIWMPTFRKSSKTHYPEEKIESSDCLPIINNMELVNQINSFCVEKKIMIYIKKHPQQAEYISTFCFSNIKVIDESFYNDKGFSLYNFLHYTDALISDYSSVSVDYLLLDKPIAFTLDDYEQYKETRGFVFDSPVDYMPGHHVCSVDDLKVFLDDISEKKDPYIEDRHRLMPLMQNPCENYCKRVWDTVMELRFSKTKKNKDSD